MSNASNNTVLQNSTSEPRMWESAIPPALQFAFGVIGNIIALVVLVMASKKHKWRPFYRLVGGLAITDGGGILLVYPTVMVRYATDFDYVFPKALCNYSSFVYTFTLISSAMIICAMSLDRFVAILYPFIYNSGRNGRRASIILGLIWITGGLVSSLQLMGLGSSFNYYPKSWCFINFVEMDTLDRINSYIYSIFGLLILLVTFGVNATVIITVIRNMKSDIRSSKRRQKNDIFIISFLLVIVIVFSSCWAPLMVRLSISYWCIHFKTDHYILFADFISLCRPFGYGFAIFPICWQWCMLLSFTSFEKTQFNSKDHQLYVLQIQTFSERLKPFSNSGSWLLQLTGWGSGNVFVSLPGRPEFKPCSWYGCVKPKTLP